MVRLPVELYQISPETLLYQIFRMNLKKVHDPGTDDLPPVFDYKNGMVCKTAYRVCPPTINSFLFDIRSLLKFFLISLVANTCLCYNDINI